MRVQLLAATAAVVLLTAGCSTADQPGAGASGAGGDDRPIVVTDMYPTTFAVEQVAGDAVQIVQLAPTGVEPHEYELTPRQVQQIADADLVAYLPEMIPAVADAAAQEASGRTLDVTAGIDRLTENGSAQESGDSSGWDPHVWLDPTNVATMGANVAAALTDLGIPADATALTKSMSELDAEFTDGLGNCASSTLVVSHEAFGYLAHAYGLTQVGISGLSPESEPSPAKMAQIADLVSAEGIGTIYFESLVSPAAAEAIAAETGTATAMLDPIEGNTDDRGYPAIMRTNLATLEAGQSCS